MTIGTRHACMLEAGVQDRVCVFNFVALVNNLKKDRAK